MKRRAKFKLVFCLLVQLLRTSAESKKVATALNASDFALPKLEFTEEPPTDVGVQIGQSIVLPCSYRTDSNAGVDVRWYKDGQPVTPDQLQSRERLRSSALSDNNTSFFPSLTNNLVVPPIVNLSRQNIPPKTRRDTSTSSVVEQDDGVHLYPNGSLLIPMARQQSAGEYHCTISVKDIVLLSRKSQLVLYVGPMFSVHPASRSIAEGESVRFICHSNVHPPSKYAWHLNQTVLPPSHRHIVLPGILQILDVKDSDAGFYACRATNNYGAAMSRSARLSVKANKVKPALSWVTTSNGTIEVEEGADIYLECLASSSFQKVTYKWTKDKTSSVCSAPQNCTMTNGNMLIPHATPSNSGFYHCIASDPSAAIRRSVHVVVYSKPVAAVPQLSYVERVIKIVKVACGDMNPASQKQILTWFLNGKNVADLENPWIQTKQLPDGRLQLVIHHMQPEFQGYFQCRAETKYGSTITTVRVELTPYEAFYLAPEKPKLVFVNASMITIAFIPLVDGACKERFLVYHFNKTHLETDYIHKVPCNGSTPFRHNLTQAIDGNNNYSIAIQALKDNRVSLLSEPLQVTTDECVPKVDVAVNDTIILGPHQVVVSWLPLSKVQACGRIIYYKIKYTKVANGKTAHIGERQKTRSIEVRVTDDMQNDKRFFALLTDLLPNTEYFVVILPATRAGCYKDSGNRAVEEERRTMEIPSNPLCYAVAQNFSVLAEFKKDAAGSNQLHLQWKISARVKVEKYVVQVRNLSRHLVATAYVLPNTTKHVISNLDPKRMYKVTLVAWSPDLQSCLNVSTAAFPGGTSSEALPSIRAEAFGLTAVNLRWTYRSTWYPDQAIDRFQVMGVDVEQRTSIPEEEATFYNSTRNSMVVKNLKPRTLYDFSVRAVFKDNVAGRSRSPFSVPFSVWTGRPVPGRVSGFTIYQSDGNISAEWKPPLLSYGTVFKYIVKLECKPGDANPLVELTALKFERSCLPSGAHCNLSVAAENKEGVGQFFDHSFVVSRHRSCVHRLPGSDNDDDDDASLDKLIVIVCVCIAACFIVLIVLMIWCCCGRDPRVDNFGYGCAWCKQSATNLCHRSTHSNARSNEIPTFDNPEAVHLVRLENGKLTCNGHAPTAPKNGVKGTNGFHKTNGFHAERTDHAPSKNNSISVARQQPTNGKRNSLFNQRKPKTPSVSSVKSPPVLSVPIPSHSFKKDPIAHSSPADRVEIPPEDDVDDFLDFTPQPGSSLKTSVTQEFENIISRYRPTDGGPAGTPECRGLIANDLEAGDVTSVARSGGNDLDADVSSQSTFLTTSFNL